MDNNMDERLYIFLYRYADETISQFFKKKKDIPDSEDKDNGK